MNKPLESSFRDPNGFIFTQNGVVYRQINHSYQADYTCLMASGLYAYLTEKRWLLAHETVEFDEILLPFSDVSNPVYKTICPEQMSFISYPSSWSFGMLKDAALLTLKIQKAALKHGMILKDASAYNVQFRGSQPVFIDTLSFEKYHEGMSWAAYGQFCRHFLAPLALMKYTDISLNSLFITQLDGVSLPLAAKLLPFKTRLSLNLYLHIHLHANTQIKFQDKKVNTKASLSLQKLNNLIQSLEDTIKSLDWKPQNTEWFDYYDKSVSDAYYEHKSALIDAFLATIKPHTLLDLGANDGTFSKIAAKYAHEILSFDIDPACVELNYQRLKKEKNRQITPLIVNILNPEPSIGWNNTERPRLFERTNCDTIMALALIHHLCISNNTPLSKIAEFFSLYCQNLIIEFVPKSDEKVQILLQNRPDIFNDYTLEGFKTAFSTYFAIQKMIEIEPTHRVLFLMSKI